MVCRATREPDLDEWAYAGAQVIAARELAWPTILVVFTRRGRRSRGASSGAGPGRGPAQAFASRRYPE